LRDAWYVTGEDVLEAMHEASEWMVGAGICPETVTILPEKECRSEPYIYPTDPDTDATLALDYLRGYIRPVLMDYALFRDLSEDRGYDAKRRAKVLNAADRAFDRMLKFPPANGADTSDEDELDE